MDLTARASIAAPYERVFDAVCDLATYPSWLTIVGGAVSDSPHPDDAGPAWAVELVGRLGPLTTKKRVRMVRVARDDAAGRTRFERHEYDGRTHNDWILSAAATPHTDGHLTDVVIELHYGGPTVPGVDLLLRRDARSAGRNLETYLTERG